MYIASVHFSFLDIASVKFVLATAQSCIYRISIQVIAHPNGVIWETEEVLSRS